MSEIKDLAKVIDFSSYNVDLEKILAINGSNQFRYIEDLDEFHREIEK